MAADKSEPEATAHSELPIVTAMLLLDEQICDLRDAIVAFDIIARGGLGLDPEDMKGVQFIANAALGMVDEVKASAGLIHERLKMSQQ